MSQQDSERTNDFTRWLPYALVPLWLLAAGLTTLAVLHGETLQVSGIRVSLRNASRPFLVLAAITLLLVHLRPVRAAHVRDSLRRVASTVPWWCVPLMLAVLVGAAGARFGSDVASGADSYGYVTQAEMLADGHLRRAESALAPAATWPNGRRSLTPLGWLPAEAGSMVPVYPPGYPLLMAGARLIHAQWMFAVVPLAGAATLLAVIFLARAIGRSDVGVAAAILLASSPAFLMSLVVPMSDMPATAAWAVATALALGHSPRADQRGTPNAERSGISHAWSAIGAGAAGGLALLIRPNLLPLSIGILLLASTQGSDRRQRWVRLLIVATGLAAGAGLVAAFQWAYYGSATANGYGRMADLFELRHWRTNVLQFSDWLFTTHPRIVLVASVVGAVLTPPRATPASRLLWLPGLTFACYVLYLPFDNWTYLRFLLPAFPVLMLWAAIGMRHVVSYLREPLPSYAFALTVAWCALAGVHEARVRNVFANAASVERFRSISLEVAKVIPPRSVVVTREFSGSLQYYAHVDTLRWDWLDASGLEQAVSALQSQERQVFALLDLRSEAPDFEKHHDPGVLPCASSICRHSAALWSASHCTVSVALEHFDGVHCRSPLRGYVTGQ